MGDPALQGLLHRVHLAREELRSREPNLDDLAPVTRYLEQRANLALEQVSAYKPASRVLDIMVARMEGGDTSLVGMGAFKVLLEELEGMAGSMEFPCPICLSTGRYSTDDCPVLRLSFDEEPGEYGTVLSSWPVLSGDCEDPRLSEGFPHHEYRRTLRNHAERINQRCEDGDLSPDMERVLGAHVERQRLASYLGVGRGRR